MFVVGWPSGAVTTARGASEFVCVLWKIEEEFCKYENFYGYI